MMSPSERRLWAVVMRRAAVMNPELAASILAAFQILRDNLSDAELARALDLGFAEQIAAQIITAAAWNAAVQPVRDQIRRGIVQSVKYFQRDLPKPPPAIRNLGVTFDYLSPKVIDAIRALESRVLTDLEASTRETVRAFIENGLRDGTGPITMARDLRSMIGLGPTQMQEVLNFRDALAGANGRSIRDYTLRNRVVDRLLAKGPLTPEQIDRYTEVYRTRRIAQNAETIARTASLDAQKLGNQLSWQDAIDKGIVDGDRTRKTWVGVMDDRERPEHVEMEGETVPFDEPFSNGQMTPGDDEYNCRCIARYWQAAA